MGRLLVALALPLVLAGCSLPGTIEARAFSTGYKAGDSYRYQLHSTVSGSITVGQQEVPVQSDQTLTETARVVSVDRSGVATIQVQVDEVDGSGATAKPVATTVVVGPDGRIRTGSALALGGKTPSIPGADQLTPVLPDHPVKPGESWDKTYSRPNPFGAGSFNFSSHGTYVKDDNLGGREVSVIDSNLKGPIDFTIDYSKQTPPPGTTFAFTGRVRYTGEVSQRTRYWLDQANHQVLKATGTGTYRMTYAIDPPPALGNSFAFNGQIKMDLAKL